MDVLVALESRRAVPSFDSSVRISADELRELVDRANLAPSSMNLQPWKIVVAHSAEAKEALKGASYNQAKITEASAVVVVCGDLQHFRQVDKITAEAVAQGVGTEERRARTIAMAVGAYESNDQKQRDEVFRGGSLWSMAFMLAATEAGWDTAPMGGFEPEKVAEVFGLPESVLPMMLIAIGKRNPEVALHPRGYRFPASEIVHFDRW